jgi:hypothetical protein
LAKLERKLKILESFCDDLNAKEAAELHGVSYVTAKNLYDTVRKKLLGFLEQKYMENRSRILEYDEHIYLDHNKRKNKRYIFDAHDFLTFDYGGKVYNILLPSLERYKNKFIEDGIDEIYYREFSRFLTLNRISRLNKLDNTIMHFWQYLDEFMKKYKGIRSDNFVYYLKEAEFKFNYPDKAKRYRIPDNE